MCRKTTLAKAAGASLDASLDASLPPQPSLLARYACASVLVGFFAVWGKFAFVPEDQQPGVWAPMHSYKVPLCMTFGYLVSLPALRFVVENYLSKKVDMKVVLKESMVLVSATRSTGGRSSRRACLSPSPYLPPATHLSLSLIPFRPPILSLLILLLLSPPPHSQYNVAQVALNGWMVYRFVDAVANRGHPFIGDIHTVSTGAPYAIFVHYMDKYLEFFDTYFMVLRGRMDQVSFLHVYHHCTIAWAWWAAIYLFPGGDSYFGALLNSWIHVMMYSYYALSLLKVRCPWKRFLTQAQLLQFTTVVVYSIVCVPLWPKDQVKIHHYACIAIQVLEMVSLFVLFSFFYRRSYGKRKNGAAAAAGAAGKQATRDDDQCQKAVTSTIETVSKVIEGNVTTR
jgi:hypothetical protein